MHKKLLSTFLYTLAGLFLLWHLLPLVAIGNVVTPKEKTNLELANDSICYGGELDALTFGDPLNDTIYTDISRQSSILKYTHSKQPIKLDADPASTKTASKSSWQANSYGKNTSALTVRPQTNSQAILRAETTSHQDGDAKWQTQLIDVKSGEQITFKADYRANVRVISNVVLLRADGSEKYITLKNLEPSKDWRSQTSTVIIPEGTKSVRFAIILDSTGWLETTNYAISRSDTPQFQRGIISFTFDDGWRSINEKGLPLFEKYGVKTTQFIVADYDINKAYMNPKQIREFQSLGHDIGSHSFSHTDHSVLYGSQLNREIAGSRAVLNKKFNGVNNYATPFGRYNADVSKVIQQCYQSHRTTDTGYNAPGYDRYQVKVQNVEIDTTPEQIRQWAKFAQDNKLWLVFVYHQVEDGGEYSVDSKMLESHLKAVKDVGIHTATYADALIETYPQGR